MTIAALWLPILLSAVLVFVASSLVHMVLKWHANDYAGVANEEAMRAAIRAGAPSPGQYVIPYCPGMKEMQQPEVQKKFQEGPIALITVRRNGAMHVGPALSQWLVFTLLVSLGVACLAGSTLAPGADFAKVAWVTGLVAFMTYAGGSITSGIWKSQPWGTVIKDLADAAIYGAVTGCAFAHLWPK